MLSLWIPKKYHQNWQLILICMTFNIQPPLIY